MLVKEGAAVDAVPSNNTLYSANTFYGSGDQLGSGNYALYSGASDNITISNLNPARTYHFAVFEYNQFATGPLYLISNPPRAQLVLNSLPVKLSAFTGIAKQNANILSWTTDLEERSRHFEVERSSDNRRFEVIATIASKGNSNQRADYLFEDKNAGGTVYYRLKMVDIDGRSEYSKTLRLDTRQTDALRLYPTVTTGSVHITMSVTNADRALWQIADAQGRIIKRGRIAVTSGANSFDIDMSTAAAGLYTIVVNAGRDTWSTPFLRK